MLLADKSSPLTHADNIEIWCLDRPVAAGEFDHVYRRVEILVSRQAGETMHTIDDDAPVTTGTAKRYDVSFPEWNACRSVFGK